MKTIVRTSEFKSKPVLEIYERPVISFGIKKAKAISSSIQDIEDFVCEHQYEGL